jgi:glutamine amidotransferase
MKLAIIDYGMGNLRSVYNAFQAVGGEATVVDDPLLLKQAERIVLPGVGAFGDGMRNLRKRGFVEALEEEVRVKEKPFLGLCLGMQVLATTGTEHGSHAGLGWIAGTVERMTSSGPGVRIPHIGWNDVRYVKRDGLYAGQGEVGTFYFVHSYILQPDDSSVISGLCRHGIEFAASVETGNIFATQCHPEKSQKCGLAALRNFLEVKI